MTFVHIFYIFMVFNIPAHGDRKKARERLRARTTFETFYSSTFRSGLLIGFAIPALIHGLLKGKYFDSYDVNGSSMMSDSTPTRDSTSDTVLGYLAFRLWLDLYSSVILSPFRN